MWRRENPEIRINLSEADLHAADLFGADLYKADLSYADLSYADLSQANLLQTNLLGADLTEASLINANCIETNFTGAVLTGCYIYGISVWDVNLDNATQRDLCITLDDQPEITVDNLKVAQFIYLMLNNEEIRDVMNTITGKVVLILGRFGERKVVLNALREELRKHNYAPIVFDFDKLSDRSYTETVTLLARIARFIVADLTLPSSLPQELQAIVPDVYVQLLTG